MAFNGRKYFTFIGKLEVLEEKTDKNGKVTKGTVRDYDKISTLVFNGNVENQGKFQIDFRAFKNPVEFTLNEVDSKGNNKKYQFNGGKLKYDETEIKDLWKSRYVLKQGDKEQIFYHGMDFIGAITKLLPNIKKGKDKILYKLKGQVEENPYNNRMYEKYIVNSFEILSSKTDEKEIFSINELFAYKREELKGTTIPVYSKITMKTKDKGYKDFFYKGEKTLKISKDYILGGILKDIPLKDNDFIKKMVKELGANSIGKIKVNYLPVINTTKSEETNYDINNLDVGFKTTYDLLVKNGMKKQADEYLKKISVAIKQSEGGGFREYFINDFEFSSDYNLSVSEPMVESEFLETDISKITNNNQNKGKLLLETLLINGVSQDLGSNDNDLGLFEEGNGDFESALSDNPIINEEQPKEEVKEETKEEPQEKPNLDVDDEFDEIFDLKGKEEKEKPKEEDKKEEVKEEEPQEAEVVETVESDEDIFADFF